MSLKGYQINDKIIVKFLLEGLLVKTTLDKKQAKTWPKMEKWGNIHQIQIMI